MGNSFWRHEAGSVKTLGYDRGLVSLFSCPSLSLSPGYKGLQARASSPSSETSGHSDPVHPWSSSAILTGSGPKAES